MNRGIPLAVLVAASAVLVPAAPAAPSPSVVYELVRTSPRAATTVSVVMEVAQRGVPNVVMAATIEPVRHGGYTWTNVSIAQLGDEDTRWRTYGTPATVPCPAAPLCASSGVQGPNTEEVTFRGVATGTRLLVAGRRGAVNFSTPTRHWKLRAMPLGFRVVTAEQSDATGVFVAGGEVEHFRSAQAASGRWGSIAWGHVPCDPGAGTYTLSLDGATQESGPCAVESATWPAETQLPGTWTFAGPVVGYSSSSVRLVVLDFPKA